MSVWLAWSLILAAPLLAAAGLFYLVDRMKGRRGRNVVLIGWLAVSVLLLLALLILISTLDPSSWNTFIKAAAVALSMLFALYGLGGAGLAWLVMHWRSRRQSLKAPQGLANAE